MAPCRREHRPLVQGTLVQPAQANLLAHPAGGPGADLHALLMLVKTRRIRFFTHRHGLDDLQAWLSGVDGLHQILVQVASVFQACHVQVEAQLAELLALANALPRLRKSPTALRRNGVRLIRQLLGQMPVCRRQAAQALAKAHRQYFWDQFLTTFAGRQRSTPRTLRHKAPRKLKR